MAEEEITGSGELDSQIETILHNIRYRWSQIRGRYGELPLISLCVLGQWEVCRASADNASRL